MFSVLDRKYSFMGNSFKKLKMFLEAEIQNLDLFEYEVFDGNFHLFLFQTGNSFWLNLVQKFKLCQFKLKFDGWTILNIKFDDDIHFFCVTPFFASLTEKLIWYFDFT